MKSLLLGLAVIALASGCNSIHSALGIQGSVSTQQSQFDGHRQVSVLPGFLYRNQINNASFMVGGFWSSAAPESFDMEVAAWGACDVTGLRVNVDGEVFNLTPAPAPTTHHAVDSFWRVESVRRFPVRLAFVRKLVAGRRVVFQLEVTGRGPELREGVFSFERIAFAKDGMQRALKEIDAAPRLSAAVK